MQLTFKKATPEDIPLLTETAFASKASWGYPDEWMELWREELTVLDAYISKHEVAKAFHENRFIGFYILINSGGGKWELDAFFIVPGEMRKGYGKIIFAHIMDFLRQQKAKKMEVISDPNANGFYKRMGGKLIGKYPSKPEGRALDIFEYEVG